MQTQVIFLTSVLDEIFSASVMIYLEGCRQSNSIAKILTSISALQETESSGESASESAVKLWGQLCHDVRSKGISGCQCAAGTDFQVIQ